VVLAEGGEVDRQPEGDEDDDLRQARERRMEAFDRALGGNVGVADQDPGDVDREEAGAVRHGGDAVDHASERERAQWVKRRVREHDPAHHQHQEVRAGDADHRADAKLEEEVADRVRD
jgi:hypothetical protein